MQTDQEPEGLIYYILYLFVIQSIDWCSRPKIRPITKAKEAPKVDRKAEKAKDKEQKKQLKLEFLMGSKEDKKSVTKQKTEQDKQLAELEKK